MTQHALRNIAHVAKQSCTGSRDLHTDSPNVGRCSGICGRRVRRKQATMETTPTPIPERGGHTDTESQKQSSTATRRSDTTWFTKLTADNATEKHALVKRHATAELSDSNTRHVDQIRAEGSENDLRLTLVRAMPSQRGKRRQRQPCSRCCSS